MRPAPLRRLAVLALLVVAPVADSAPADRKFVTLRGRVADAEGTPLGDVRIEAEGTREAIALTSPEGRFTLTLDLGALNQIQMHPVTFSVRARRVGYRILVAGGAPELAVELRVGEENGEPVMQARSNYGIIADALLDALAPPGDRNATLQVSFKAERGARRDSFAVLPPAFSSVPMAEPWLKTPAAAIAPKDRGAPPRREEAPARREEPAGRGETAVVPPREVPAASPRPDKKAEESRPEPKAAKPPRKARRPAGATATRAETRGAAERPSPFAPPRPAPVPAHRADSLRRLHEAEQRAAVAAAQAERDSLWAVRRAQSRALKAVTDSLRAIREAAEDSTRRARYRLPRRPAPVASTPAPTRAPTAGRRRSGESRFAPAVGGRPAPSGLQRVDVRDGAKPEAGSDAVTREALEADSCTCRVRGTIETEFHRLLASPLKVEVSIRELPALRDTVDLFMGSPRAFEFARVPCGRWSLAIRPFSERPFGVTTPEEVAPFDCRARGLRQVRVVIAPLRTGR